ncbi:MAG: TIR domain-containing protein [Gammaproteobacteria bacterium]|nr:TIR domain-containing protein [Gammaproteobacteria bacterium]
MKNQQAPYEGTEPYVFVSYSHANEELVYAEISWLQQQGVNVWYDTGIHPGSEWSEVLASAIKGASQVFYFITPQSVDSENCRQELNFALTEGVRVQAVHLVETVLPDGLRLRLENRQAILKHKLNEADYRRALLRGIVPVSAETTVIESGEGRTSTSTFKPWLIVTFIAIVLGLVLIETQFDFIGTSGPDAEESAQLMSSPGTPGAIAILPLVNLSGDIAQEYLADGMTAELISEIGRLENLTVISQTSVMRYKTERPSVPTIAEELGVDWVLEGGVAREGDAIRVNVNLIAANTDTQVWSSKFDRQGSSMLAIRSDIAAAIADELRLELGGGASEAEAHVVNEEAYDAYLRGIGIERSRRPDVIAAKLQALQTAVELDPEFAQAWSELAIVYFAGFEDFELVREYAERAIELDPKLAEPHALLAQVANLHDMDGDASQRHMARALELNPNSKLSVIVSMFVNSSQQRFEEALIAADRLKRLNPLDADTKYVRVELFTHARLYERGIAEAIHARKFVSPGNTYSFESMLFTKLGRFEDAALARFDFLRQCGVPCAAQLSVAEKGWREGGHDGRLRAEFEYLNTQSQPATDRFRLAIQQGDLTAAFEWLSQSVEGQFSAIRFLVYLPIGDRLRMDPRFVEITRGFNLPQFSAHPAQLADEGRVLAFMGNGTDAIERIQRAMDQSPEDERLPRWQESLAWAHFANEAYAEATKRASNVLEHDLSVHSEAFAYLLIASSQGHLQRPDEAQTALSRALDLWPTLDFERDLAPLFLGGDESMRDAFVQGLGIAGLSSG